MKSPNRSLVSIIIPTMNRSCWLRDAVSSVQRQSYDHWEVIVVDDGSSEIEKQQARETLGCLPNVRLHERFGTKAGAPVCRNQGLQFTRGKYILFLDDDDGLAPHCLAHRVAKMEADPALDLLVSPCQVFREVMGDSSLLHNIETGDDALDRFLCLDIPWQTAGPLWRREALDRIGPWNENLPSFQDWDFHVRALIVGLRYKWSGREPDCFWRMPSTKVATLGVISQSSAHLSSHFYLFCEVAGHLGHANLLTEDRKRMVAGLFFWLSEAWIKLGCQDQALFVWNKCRDLQILSADDYATGQMMLRSAPRILLRRVLRKLFVRPYPRCFRAGDYSKTSRCRHV